MLYVNLIIDIILIAKKLPLSFYYLLTKVFHSINCSSILSEFIGEVLVPNEILFTYRRFDASKSLHVIIEAYWWLLQFTIWDIIHVHNYTIRIAWWARRPVGIIVMWDLFEFCSILTFSDWHEKCLL